MSETIEQTISTTTKIEQDLGIVPSSLTQVKDSADQGERSNQILLARFVTGIKNINGVMKDVHQNVRTIFEMIERIKVFGLNLIGDIVIDTRSCPLTSILISTSPYNTGYYVPSGSDPCDI